MNSKNYYQILGLTSEATDSEIRKKYKKLALKYHPDRNKTEEARKKFLLIQEAYKVLSDKQSRQKYDNQQKYQQNDNFNAERDFFSEYNKTHTWNFKRDSHKATDFFSDFFSFFFKEGKKRTVINLKLNFIEFCLGAQKIIERKRIVYCVPCKKCLFKGRKYVMQQHIINIPSLTQKLIIKNGGDFINNNTQDLLINIDSEMQYKNFSLDEHFNLHIDIEINPLSLFLQNKILIKHLNDKIIDIDNNIINYGKNINIILLQKSGLYFSQEKYFTDLYIKIKFISLKKNLNLEQISLLKKFYNSLENKNFFKNDYFKKK